MRKLLAITLIIAFLISVAGCKKQSSASGTTSTQQNPTQQDPAQETETEPTIPQENPTIAQNQCMLFLLCPKRKKQLMKVAW